MEGTVMQSSQGTMKKGTLEFLTLLVLPILTGAVVLMACNNLMAQEKGPQDIKTVTPPSPAKAESTSQPDKTPPNATEAKPTEVKESKKEPEVDPEVLKVQKEIASYVKAFNEKNGDALADHWSVNGVYETPSGKELAGRDEIRAAFTKYFADQKEKVTLKVMTQSIEILSANVAEETGWAEVIKGEEEPLLSSYVAYYLKEDGRWKLDSVKEADLVELSPHYEALSGLEWLIGDWVDANGEVVINTSNQWTRNQNFITSNFSVTMPDQPELTGVQIIGYDPVAEVIRSWVFDSDGGFGTGTWAQDGDRWSVHSLYITADGKSASSINIYQYVDENSFSFESVGRERDGQLMPSIPKVIVQRR